jgi:hypothetical protein
MGNTAGAGAYSALLQNQFVNPQTGMLSPAAQRFMLLVLQSVVNGNGQISGNAQVSGVSGSLGSNVTALQAQTANLNANGIILPSGVNAGSVSGITSDSIASGSSTIIPTQTRMNNATDTAGNLLLKNLVIATLSNQSISTTVAAKTPSVNVTTHGKPVLVLILACIQNGSTAQGFLPYLYRDGSPITSFATAGQWGGFVASVTDTRLLPWLDTPAAGAHTYQLYLGANSASATLYGGSIIVLELG